MYWSPSEQDKRSNWVIVIREWRLALAWLALGTFAAGLLLAWWSADRLVVPLALAAEAVDDEDASHVPPPSSVSPQAPQGVRITPLIDQGVFRDFVVGPGKYEVFLAPGEEGSFTLSVSNRMGDDRVFQLSVEDAAGDPSGKEPVVLLGNDRGPYSVRDWVEPAVWKIEIPHGHKATIPVRIRVPSDASPGGYYGSLLVSTVSKDAETDDSGISGATKVVSRIGVLLFVRVPGEVVERGSLVAFRTKEASSIVSHGDPLTFLITYRNEGNVHLNPSARITVRNMLGRVVHEIVVPPWYVLPQAQRTREVEWEVPYWLGRYTATLTLAPGYEGGTEETAQLTFWVVSWQAVALLVGLFVVLFGLFVFLPRRYAIVRK